MFQPRFAPMVEDGRKYQTVRALPKRMPRAGDILSARKWTGAPYRSKQRELRVVTLDRVANVHIDSGGVWVDGKCVDPNLFAQADGFEDFHEMCGWFKKTHSLPFAGIGLFWQPPR